MNNQPLVRPSLISLGLAFAWPLAAQTNNTTAEEIVRLSPFEVTAANDRGYGTTNSLGATRMNISVMETPQVVVSLNEKFIKDTVLIEMEDIASYVAAYPEDRPKGPGV
jgi:outer membrane receptor for ferric coprogen and ferric-rhodotorulic acid